MSLELQPGGDGMAAKYHHVSTKFWDDERVLFWDDDTKLLALYLLTCRHRTTEGLFRLPKGYILDDLGSKWTMRRLSRPFSKLLAEGFIKYDNTTSVVLLCQALTYPYNRPENPNQVTAAVRAVGDLPQTPLLTEFIALAEANCQRLAQGLRQQLGQRLGQSPFSILNAQDSTSWRTWYQKRFAGAWPRNDAGAVLDNCVEQGMADQVVIDAIEAALDEKKRVPVSWAATICSTMLAAGVRTVAQATEYRRNRDSTDQPASAAEPENPFLSKALEIDAKLAQQ